jgi:nitroreductase
MQKDEPLHWIHTRRSIRKYTDKAVPDSAIEEILRAAMYAPSAVNRQPWHFIVVSDREMFNRIMEIHPNASFLETASKAILVCGDDKLQHDDGYYVVDCGAATQNLLLAAHMLGIGSCWIGVHPREERKRRFSELFGLPEHVHPFALVSLGYASEEKSTPERFRPERIHYNTWGNK